MDWRWALVGSSPGRTLIRGLSCGALLLVASQTIVVPVRATGISMLPTYDDGQLIFFNAVAYRFASPQRGDVVAITTQGRQVLLVKRIIGLPGERVRIEGGTVVVNDLPLPEGYVRLRAAWDVAEVVLGPDEYYVVGDNRGMSARNHTFGVVSGSHLFGRLLF